MQQSNINDGGDLGIGHCIHLLVAAAKMAQLTLLVSYLERYKSATAIPAVPFVSSSCRISDKVFLHTLASLLPPH